VNESPLHDVLAKIAVPQLARSLAAALEACADPRRAPGLAADVLAAALRDDARRLKAVARRAPAHPSRVLAALCGAAPFLVPTLRRYPEVFFELAEDDLSTARNREHYDLRLKRVLSDTARGGESAALRRFKYRELARITVRDLSADRVPEERAEETLAELSHLADALLSAALEVARARLAATLGAPRWAMPGGGEVTLGFCVLGLGKLGAGELNYSSDVDLIHVFESPPGTVEGEVEGGPRGLSPAEYFTRLAQEFGRLVGETTDDGFLYRIDLDLRPEGSQGSLVISNGLLANYYETYAATWERAAFTKARPVAGDPSLGWRTIRDIAPMIYRASMDFAAVAAIKEMKDRIERAKERAEATYDVKIGSGGIRDVEFVAQALQLLHGGRIPQVRDRSTAGALTALAEVGVLPRRESEDLLAAYRFLRRAENRLQMEAERQTHRLPRDHDGLQRLARAMGFLDGDPVQAFEARLASHRQRTREIFAGVFPASGGDQILGLFEQDSPELLRDPTTEKMVRELAEQFARAIGESPNPERALNNLDRFIQGVRGRRFYYELLLDRPELVRRLTRLFTASEYFSGYLATHPRLIEPIFSDPSVLLLSHKQLEQSLAAIRRSLAKGRNLDEDELELDALRMFHNRELINVGLLDLAGKVTPSEAEGALTDIAELTVEHGLKLAQAVVRRRSSSLPKAAKTGEFLVVGMGKLATRELTYGSDLDVIFLYEVPGADESEQLEAQEYFVRLAQKFIWTQQTRTAEGVCYAIDARLRPSGNQGLLVTSLAAFEKYHATSAQVWEKQALLRARPVAGGKRLSRAFPPLRLEILRRPLPPNAGREIHRVRLRMEAELAQETRSRHDFKTGRGGLQDVETVVQYLQLEHGREHAELLSVEGARIQIDRLERLDLLAREDAAVLRDGWGFLQLLSNRLRVIENRSISDLDEERGDLESLAASLGYTSPQRAGGARRALLEDYGRHTAAIRRVYRKVLDVESNGG
jgi:glutamate-ammonia-ligase adenylyltransferase